MAQPLTRPKMFAMRLTPEEQQMIYQLAAHEERTPSDVVRRLIRHAFYACFLPDKK